MTFFVSEKCTIRITMKNKNKSFGKKGFSPRLPTTFKRKKFSPMGGKKKFKNVKNLKRKLRQAVSDASFSLSYLDESKVSTPMIKKSQLKNTNLRPAVDINDQEESVLISGTHEPVLPSPVPAAASTVKPRKRKNVLNTLTEVSAITDDSLPKGQVLKNVSDMFRNDHVVSQPLTVRDCPPEPPMDKRPKFTIEKQSEECETITIDDDNETLETIDETYSTIEEIGEEMLKVVDDSDGNEQNKDVRAEWAEKNVVANIKDSPHDTITLSDSDEEDMKSRPPARIEPSNLQDIVNRYPSTAPEFIPLPSGSRPSYSQVCQRGGRRGGDLKRRLERAARGRGRGGTVERRRVATPVWKNVRSGPRERGGGRSRGRGRAAAQVVSSIPTMLVGRQQEQHTGRLRPIVIDGPNVMMAHGRNEQFSARGIELVVRYFLERGHTEVSTFLPQHMSNPGKTSDPGLLNRMFKEGRVTYTPSRWVDNRRITSYDDTFTLDYAASNGGVVISRDNYRDLYEQKAEWREVVEQRLLMPTFIGDTVMFPHDPLGRDGPSLDAFLMF